MMSHIVLFYKVKVQNKACNSIAKMMNQKQSGHIPLITKEYEFILYVSGRVGIGIFKTLKHNVLLHFSQWK